jgi:hypothetical protein
MPIPYIRTIQDMEKMYYTRKGLSLLQQEDLQTPFHDIAKTDAPVLTTTTGVYQARYGVQAWVQLNQEANTFGVLPKAVWTRSGWRVITARTTTLPTGGVAENAALPDTTKPTFAQVSTKPKTVAQTFENTEQHEFLAQEGNDDAVATMAFLREYMAREHKENVNAMLNATAGTLAGNNIESIDRIVGSNDELSNANDASGASYDAGDLDPYASASFDRDGGASWVDAYVSHGSGTLRSLTDAVIQDLVQNTLLNGANPEGQIFQTKYDTWSTMNQLYDPQVRYNLIGTARITGSVNGIQTLEGRDVGMAVSTWNGKPVVVSKDNIQDTSGIGRLFLLDISNPEGHDYPRLFFKVAKPTQYFEAGMNQGTPFSIDKFGTEGMYRTMGELICSFFKVQGKASELKA